MYTSSAAAAIPNPFSVLYASTKAFISTFGASLAAEVKPSGIDVLVFHPSPVASRFYDKVVWEARQDTPLGVLTLLTAVIPFEDAVAEDAEAQ